MRCVLVHILFITIINGIRAQEAVVSSYFNAADQRDEWIEILVIQDNLDMRNWSLRDDNSTQSAWQPQIIFNNIPFWSHMRTGTIIIIWNRQYPSSSTTILNPLDIISDDGYIEVHANDIAYFNGGNFGSSPTFAGATLNFAGGGDIVQLRNASSTHVHALGHRTAVGADFSNLPNPKLNHTAALASNEAVFVCPGTNISEYGTVAPQIGTTYTAKDLFPAVTKGLPNTCAAGLTANSNFWRATRQPGWVSPSLIATPNAAYTQVSLSWNASTDPYPADATQGYLILRNNINTFTDPTDGISYTNGALIGSATVVTHITSSTTTTYTDNIAIPCNENLYYRIYAYRYSVDNGNIIDVARGRAYNETNFAEAMAVGPVPPTTADAGADQSLCGAFTTTLAANSPLIGYGLWTVTSGPGIVNFGSTSIYNTTATVTIPGIYVLRWTISNGAYCPDSYDEVTIEFSNAVSVSASSNSPVCTGDDIQLSSSISGASCLWSGPNGFNSSVQNPIISGATLLQAGTYTITVTGIPGGCPPTTNSTDVSIAQSPVAPALVTSNILNICSDDPGNIILTATGGNGSVIEWFTGSCGGTYIGTGSPLTIESPIITTTYYARWNSAFCGSTGCNSVTVIVTDPPTVSNAGSDQSICGVLTANLEGNNPLIGAGTWTIISGPGTANFVNNSLYNTLVSVSVTGTYIFRWTISNGVICPSSNDDVSLTFSNAIVVLAGSNSPVCSGSYIQLTSSISGATYSWTGPNGFISDEQNPVLINVSTLQAGSYTITVTNIPGGCPATSNSTSVTVNTSPSTPLSLSSDKMALCADDPGNITLTANGGSGTVIEWSEGSCGGNLVGTGPSLTINSPTTTTTYFARWNSTSCGYSSCENVTVTVYDPPTVANAGGDQSLCGTLTATLNGNNPLIGNGLWTQISGPGTVNFVNASLYNSTAIASIQGIYVLRWTITNGTICQPSYDDVFIEFGNGITVTAGSNSPICEGDTIFLTSSISGATYSWTGPNGFTSTVQNPSILNVTTANSGTYTIMVSNIPGGCPSTSNSTVVAVNTPPITPAISSQNVVGNRQDVCIGNLFPYTIENPTAGSVYTWSLTGGGTIINTASSNLINIMWNTVGGPDTLTVVETTADGCTGAPVILIIIVNSLSTASVSITVDNNPVCTGQPATLTATPVNGGTSPKYTWFVNGIQAPGTGMQTYTYIPINGDKVHVRQETSSPCAFPNLVYSDTISMSVTSTVTPGILISTPATSLCTGDLATITSVITNGGSSPAYSWFVNGVLQAGMTADTFSFVPNNGDAVMAKMVSSLGCAAPLQASSSPIFFSVYLSIPVGLSISQQNVLCHADPVTINAAPANPGSFPVYEWYLNNSLVPGQQSSKLTGPFVAGDQVFARLNSSLSCATGNPAKSNDITITKPPLLEISKIDTVNESCGLSNGSITITATGGTGQVMYAIASPPAWVNDPVFDSLTASNPYSIQIKDANGCMAIGGIVMLSNKPGITVSATGGGGYCTGDTVKLEANSVTNGSYEWLFPAGNTFIGKTLTLNSVTAIDSGLYQVIARETTTGCPDTAWQLVKVNKLPKVSLDQPPVLCAGTKYMLTPGTGYRSYLWQDGTTNIEYPAINQGLYYVIATDYNGCSGSDSVSLVNCAEVYIPSAFSPNGDFNNDKFRPVTGGKVLLDFSMIIFSRWGQKIFESNDYLNGWDGTINGSDQPSGLYTYLISFKLADPSNPASLENTKLRGTVILIR